MKDKPKKESENCMSSKHEFERDYFENLKRLSEEAYAAYDKVLDIEGKESQSDGIIIEGDYIIENDYYNELTTAMSEFIEICRKREALINLMRQSLKNKKGKGKPHNEGGESI